MFQKFKKTLIEAFRKFRKSTKEKYNRLRVLTLLQLSDRFKFNKDRRAKAIAARAGLIVLAFALITAIATGLIYALCNLVFIPKTYELITFVIYFIQVLSIIACTSGLLKTLYKGKDNPILLSYPAQHYEVFLSKLLVFYIYEFLKGVFLILPLLLGFGIVYEMITFGYIITTIIMILILPLFPVLIGAILTMPILIVTKFLNKFQIVKFILSAAFGIFAFWSIVKLTGLIPVPLRIVALYGSFIIELSGFIASVNKYALHYQLIGKILMGQNVFVNYLIIFAILIGLVVLIISLAMPLYFSLASKSGEQANQKKHKGINKMSKTTFLSFVKKEWLLSIRNINDFISNYVFIVAIPYVLYLMVSIFTAVDRNVLGHSMTIGFTGFIALMMASASNTASAMAITQEGAEFVLLKTAPADTTKMAWAKIFFNLIFSSLILILSFVVLTIFATRIENIGLYWLLLIAILMVNAGLIFWSIQLDIMNPKLREYAASGDNSSNKNASKSILIGMVITVIFTFLTIIIIFSGGDPFWQWFKIIGIAFIFLASRIYLFNSYLKVVFPEIEF